MEERDMEPVNILGLKLPTDPRWVNIAEKSIEDILIDHAYCEQKAATTCISLIIRFYDKEEIVEQVSPIVAEEWAHFRRVLRELKNRGYRLKTPRKDEYVHSLLGFRRNGVSRDDRMLDELLICALIEARSCERFRLLSLYINDDDLKKFYHEFMISEAGHYTLFIKLAETYFDRQKVRVRWQEFLDFEANFLKTFEFRSDRFH